MAFGGGVSALRATCKAITGFGVGVRGTACARKMPWHLQLDERGTERLRCSGGGRRIRRLGRRHARGAACWQGQNTRLGWFWAPWPMAWHASEHRTSTNRARTALVRGTRGIFSGRRSCAVLAKQRKGGRGMTYGSRLSTTVRGGVVMKWQARCGLDQTVCYSGGMLGRPTHGWARAVRLGLARQAGWGERAGSENRPKCFSSLF
jgi:hypothetical protein